jgi:glycosyltransferase involved in cell wall biosynthesis
MRITSIKNKKVSVIIANYNKSIYLDECIKSIQNQNYSNIQTIVVDNKSTDNSLEILRKYKKIILIENKTHSNVGAYDQLNAYKLALPYVNGEIIFFLDSDDFFKKNKIIKVLNFLNNSTFQVCADLPIFYFNSNNQKKKKLLKNFFFSPWPSFSPHSCISIKKEYLIKILKTISIKKFPKVWMDFRILTHAYLQFGTNNILEKYLTLYRQNQFQSTSNYKFLSSNWLKRRFQAHAYFNYACKKLNKKRIYTLDFFVTYFVCKLFKLD